MAEAIVALSTPPGIAGLSVIRASGDGVFDIVDQCFKGKVRISEAKTHTIHYGEFHNKGKLVDFVTVAVFRKPNSYTGEDVAEISCHGGYFVAYAIIETLIEHGCRLAEPGEFTKRAFLNGRMDLTQVEAVADIIHSSSEQAYQTAVRQLAGEFSKRIAEFKKKLLDSAGLLELELDFADEGFEFIDRNIILKSIDETIAFCQELANSYHSSEILRSGYFVGIAGFPNSGKSTLFNALLKRKRAIVSEIPGTTRDYLEETIYIDGFSVRLIDTAGLRATEDIIEIEGIRMVESLLAQSNLILVINDLTQGQTHSDALFFELRERYKASRSILIQNKIDLVESQPQQRDFEIFISAKNNQGLDKIQELIREELRKETQHIKDVLINQRHHLLLKRAGEELRKARESLLEGLGNELVADDLRKAVKTLGEIVGDTFSQDVLNNIFSKFCIGK
ncbi:tRNA uridine-5-carboxymethylaminomethyl(34) synthesis GTPase MnmE [Bacteroidetes/Chlorobi group bacterium Naka2016]|jgi:tRNA modification GTPase|nr:MAG: tRNA uridine-5-carboxymethylaminomethyl(34) synthesis GTPase MnmE [Bacteroidetes/Chlorobi group bacterium Naka2016]